MKLRIKGDSLRLRLTRGEVAALASDGVLSERMQLPGASLTYAIVADPDATSMSAQLHDGALTVTAPAAMVRSWVGSEAISLEAQDGPLRILVEKDFACLTPREGEDDSDAFPNPNTAC